MKHSTFSHADLFILDGQNYRYMSAAADGIVLTRTDPPHSSRAELEVLMTSPGFRFVRGGLERAASERSLSRLPPHFRDLLQAKREIALWRQAYVEEFLAQVQGGQAKRNEASVAAILPTLIAAVTTRQRRAQSHRGKRAGRLEAGRTPPCPKTLLTWTLRYERSGFDIMALVPLSCRSGRHGGWLDPGEIVLFQKLIAAYASPLRPSIDQVRERARNLYAGFNEHREAEGLPPVRAPSRSRVYRAIKRLAPYETYVQRHGVQAANRKFAIMCEALRPHDSRKLADDVFPTHRAVTDLSNQIAAIRFTINTFPGPGVIVVIRYPAISLPAFTGNMAVGRFGHAINAGRQGVEFFFAVPITDNDSSRGQCIIEGNAIHRPACMTEDLNDRRLKLCDGCLSHLRWPQRRLKRRFHLGRTALSARLCVKSGGCFYGLSRRGWKNGRNGKQALRLLSPLFILAQHLVDLLQAVHKCFTFCAQLSDNFHGQPLLFGRRTTAEHFSFS